MDIIGKFCLLKSILDYKCMYCFPKLHFYHMKRHKFHSQRWNLHYKRMSFHSKMNLEGIPDIDHWR